MDKSIELNDWVLDELVSGTLDQQEYRQVLLALDEQPDKWRQCALAFLEAQALRKELVGLAQEGRPIVALQPIEEVAKSDSLPASAEGLSPGEKGLDLGGWWKPAAAQFSALAALVLLSFGVGWMLAGQNGSDGVGSNPPEGLAVSNTSDDPSNALVRHASDSRQTTVELDPGLEQRAGAEEPLWATGDSQMHWANFVDDGAVKIDRQIPEPLRRLQQQGRIEIESAETLVPVTLDDGSINLIPVQELRLKPKVFSY